KVSMAKETVCSNGQFTYQGVTYTAPADGRYRIGLLNEGDFKSPNIPKGDLNLDGNPPGSSRVFAVLWNKSSNMVWVDTNQNHRFEDETALTDYNVRYDAGLFGKDNPATRIRETVAFAITAAPRNEFIRLFPLLNSHATATASAAAGRGFFGGNMNGVAPGARVITIMNSLTNHGLIEGMIQALRDSRIDLVSVQIGSVERLKDGASVISTIWNRLIDRYKKPIFMSAANSGPGLGTMSECSLGSNVISTGGYVHRDTWFVDEGLKADKDDYVVNLSSRGPRQDGGFKPDIIAPSLGVYSTLASRNGIKSPYEMPPGYTIAEGTSQANPMAAGAAALLISAAKQTGIPYDADRLKRALKYSARFLPDYAPHEQGDGLVQTAAAWSLLQRNDSPVVISSKAPVKHALSRYLKVPDQGPGIYESDAWTSGEREQRIISFTRQSGPDKALDYKMQWIGNDGTFTSPDTITLPLNAATTFPVTVSPKTSGAHSAILRLLDADSQIAYEVMNTIVAAEEFTNKNGFSISGAGELHRFPGYQSYFFRVPEHTAAFKFEMTVGSGNLRSTLLDPAGKEYGFLYTLPRGVRPPHLTSGSQSRTVANPEPGVWEVVVVNHDFSDAERNKDRDPSGLLAPAKQLRGEFTYTASVYAVNVRPPLEAVEFFPRDTEQLEVGFFNQEAPFVGATRSEALGSGYFDRPFFTTQDLPRIYEIDVPPGTETLRAQINAADFPGTDVDLYLYECTANRCGVYEPLLHHNCNGNGCELRAFGIGPSANEMVEVVNPNPGKWKVVVDPASLPAGKIECDYLDLFTHQAFGEISSDEKAEPRSAAQSWKETIKVNVNAVPQGERTLVGLINMTSDRADTITYTVQSIANLTKNPVERHIALGSVVIRFETDGAKNKSSKSAHH
ncbi:MAG TPA: S8 family serine peptidase, partial [Pyrinomonadaceae bacterium]|nr:S8 family serine peptidase [Pyrinomonadaceae bacterium]